jgi:hypothetical protein
VVNHGRRLDRLALVWRRPEAPPAAGATAFDPARLTFREQFELDQLLAPLAPLPGEACDLDPLTLAQLERLAELSAKGYGTGAPR